MLQRLEKCEAESLKTLPALGVYKNLELKGITYKRRTVWAQVYDCEEGKFYALNVNRDNVFKHKGKRISMDVFFGKGE